jgi:sugar phosphate isomerase/epimerase
MAYSTGAALLLARSGYGAEAKKKVVPMKISSQEDLIPGRSFAEKTANLERYGFDAVELGGRGLPGRVSEVKSAIRGRPIVVSAICAGYGGCLISPDSDERRKAVSDMRDILSAAGELGSTGLIMVPAFNDQYTIPDLHPYKSKYDLARALLVEQLKPLGEHAAACGTRILMEPLNRYEASFLNRVADAVSICKEVRNPGVCVMADFFHMNIEERNSAEAIRTGGSLLHHIHLADNTRLLPGQGEMDFLPGFRALQDIGYSDFCSLECGIDGDPEVELPKCVKLLRKNWDLDAGD